MNLEDGLENFDGILTSTSIKRTLPPFPDHGLNTGSDNPIMTL